jgi:hypothetical protein
MSSTSDDHRVNGGATPARATVSTRLGRGEMLARKVRRRGTKEWRMTGHCMRRTVWVRKATRSKDAVRLDKWEEGSVG